ncbi:MAG: 50S ribosomal protein L6 [Clostridia bacterium]|nr:50S ribosomal protein L6 [Clostridia bacterium]
MSRIGRMPITIPAGVEVKVGENNVVTVKGPKGTLTKELHPEMKISVEAGVATVTRPSEEKMHKSLHGLTRTLLNNMVEGVTNGFSKELDVNGVGYRVQKNGKTLVLNLGYSHPIEMPEEDGITIDVPNPNKIIVSGIDKQKVGQFAAVIREQRPPEPYKGKGIKYVDEYIRRKEGKAGKAKK